MPSSCVERNTRMAISLRFATMSLRIGRTAWLSGMKGVLFSKLARFSYLWLRRLEGRLVVQAASPAQDLRGAQAVQARPPALRRDRIMKKMHVLRDERLP